LNNVTSIEGGLWISYNTFLTSLSGLDNVTSIGGGYFGESLAIEGNDAMTNLTGLDKVASIEGYISILNNAALVSLTGLDNISAASIDSLFIYDNTSLSACEAKSVCDYILSPGGTVEIHDNAPGCNSQGEVEEACTMSVGNRNPEKRIAIFPNPANGQLIISIKDGKIEEVIIYNQTGQKVFHKKPKNNIIDVSYLQSGMYIIEIVSGQMKIRDKLMVE